MYRLKKWNVVKETESAEKRDFLLGQGYVLLEEAAKRQASRKGKPKEENNADDGGEPDPAG